jgi:NAD+ synthase
MFDAVKVKDECIKWIQNFFENNGKDCNAVVGISGGADSSVVAALLVEALGKDRVVGVLMPDGEQIDIGDSIKLVRHLGIKWLVADISDAVCGVKSSIREQLEMIFGTNLSNQTVVNLPPRIRMATLYAVSQSINGRVANTCNFSEDYVGYSTRWGDSVGDFAPLAGLTKDEVVAIGDACGLPYELTHKTPADGLCGKTDEDNLGFTYEVLNKYILTGVCEDEAIRAKIDEKHRKNLFKLKPIPTFVPSRG